jgi:hypothetical protein
MTMRLPEITHGQEQQGSVRISPDIPEHMEIAKRIEHILQAIGNAAIVPSLRSRSLKDFRVAQPNGGLARISAAFSSERGGRYSGELHASHSPSGLESHYSLTPDTEHWLRTDTPVRGQVEPQFIDHGDMVRDVLEYAPRNGSVAKLLDKAPTASDIITAVFDDMNRSAHHKSGSDHFRVVLATIDEGGYAYARHIELVDARENNRIRRQLSVTALTSIGLGPVDVTQSLVYDVELNRRHEVVEDDVHLIHKSGDGLSSNTLARYAASSDIATRPIDIFHDALDELSRKVFLDSDVA